MSDNEWTVEVTPAARAAISRAIKDRYDGRELGGALVGHTDGDRIVVTNANGLGRLRAARPGTGRRGRGGTSSRKRAEPSCWATGTVTPTVAASSHPTPTSDYG